MKEQIAQFWHGNEDESRMQMYYRSYPKEGSPLLCGLNDGAERNFSVIFFNCWIIVLQHCVSFCCMPMWISSKYTYSPPLWSLPPTYPQPTPQSCHKAGIPVLYRSFSLAIYFTHGRSCMYVDASLSTCPSLSFPCCQKNFSAETNAEILWICIYGEAN